jgi:hypothetical protein|tara:strand:- start:175 stop:414 length:240 start_codon:yes stop_codon:yes gene_type:complete
MLDNVKKWIGQIVEVGLLLVALGIVAQILFGSNGQPVFFVGGIVSNLLGLIDQLGDNGLVGLIALAIILWLFIKKAPNA